MDETGRLCSDLISILYYRNILTCDIINTMRLGREGAEASASTETRAEKILATEIQGSRKFGPKITREGLSLTRAKYNIHAVRREKNRNQRIIESIITE